MFDVGFSELIVIGVVALVVIGPERLPAVARTVGAMLGRAQRYFNSVKAEVNRELQLEELKRIQQETYDRVMAMEAEVHSGLSQIEHSVQETAKSVTDPVAELTKDVDAALTAPGGTETTVAEPVAKPEPAKIAKAKPVEAKVVETKLLETEDPAALAIDAGQTDLFASSAENLSRLNSRSGS